MNTRKITRLLREVAESDAERSRLMLQLAEAFESEEEAEAPDSRARRIRGKGSMLLAPLQPVTEIDRKAAANRLQTVGLISKKKR
ncbi:MAG: hypothetical protein ABI134_35215 [Byssovorax sp.]